MARSPFFLPFAYARRYRKRKGTVIDCGRCVVHSRNNPLLRVNVVKLSSYLRLACVAAGVMVLTGCGSIISRTVPVAGHGHQYYPGVQWDLRDTPWRYVTVIDVPLSMVVDTFMLPFDAQHGPYE